MEKPKKPETPEDFKRKFEERKKRRARDHKRFKELLKSLDEKEKRRQQRELEKPQPLETYPDQWLMYLYRSGKLKSGNALYDRAAEYEKKRERKEASESNYSHLTTAIKNIREAQLEAAYQNDEEQIKLLEDTKEKALKKIEQLLADVNRYMRSIASMDETKRDREAAQYVEALTRADENRKIAHDNVVASIQSTVRYISRAFAEINEEVIEEYEEEREERGLPILEIQRKPYPGNILVPKKVNLRDRYSIGDWAFKIYEHLTVIKEDLSAKNAKRS